MRLRLLVLPAVILAFTGNAHAACTSKEDIEAAFAKQRQQGWHTEILSKGESGQEQTQIFDYLPPNRMYRKVTSGDETVETIGIDLWAWSNAGGGWSQMQPPFAQMVWTHLQQTLEPPKVSADFKCLGPTEFEGKTFNAYQTAPEKGADGRLLARTILIDPATGLPAFNLISAPDDLTEALHREAYTYPEDISIERPL